MDYSSRINYTLKYRASIVQAKRAWEKVESNSQDKVLKKKKSEIAKEVLSRQEELKIYGGGIAILSKAAGKPILLFSPDVQSHFRIRKEKEYEYLNTPYKIDWIGKGFANFTDLLFFISRDTVYPEYIKNIQKSKKRNFFEYPFQFKIRKEYEILHCSAGEVLYFTLLWRLIIELIIKNNNLNIKYDESLFNTKKQQQCRKDVFLKTKNALIEKILFEKLNQAYNYENKEDEFIHDSTLKAEKYFLDSIECKTSVGYIFTQLGLFNDSSLNELNKYVEYLYGESVPQLTKTNADIFAPKMINEFIKIVKPSNSNLQLIDLLNSIHKIARLPVLPYYFLILFDRKKELKEHLVFPLWYTFSKLTKYEYKKDKFESAILHGLYTIKPIWEIAEYDCSNWYTDDNETSTIVIDPGFKKYLNDILTLFTSMSKVIIDKEYYATETLKNIDLIKKQATISAISQYMCRNLSHNIGSHSIPQFNQLLSDKIQNKENWDNSMLYQIKGYNDYIQGRMEFLAEFSSKKFSDLYVEYSIKSICEKLKSSIEIKDSQRNSGEGKTSGEYEIVFKGMIDHLQSDSLKIRIGDIPIYNEIVDIRGDNLGIQAFYIIIENFIRNLYKHSKPIEEEENKKKFKLIFYIKLSEHSDPVISRNFYAIDIIDKHGFANEDTGVDNVTVNNIPGIQGKTDPLDNINKLIRQKILKSNEHTLRDQGWGMLEMKSAAAYLLGLPMEFIDSEYSERINVNGEIYPYPLVASYHKDKKSDKNIGYRIYLPKSKFCLIDIQPPENHEELKLLGIEFGSESGGKHKFFIGKSNSRNELFSNQRYVNLEILPKDFLNNLNLQNGNEFKTIIWEAYLKQFEKIKGKEVIYARDTTTPQVIRDPKESIVFNVHAVNINCFGYNSKELSKERLFPENIEQSAFYYYESYPSACDFSPTINPIDEPYLSMLKETAAIKVSIFDERIQASSYSLDEQAYDKNYFNLPNRTRLLWRDILLSSGVYIPNIEQVNLLDLVIRKNDQEIEKLKNLFIERIAVSDYMLIHFTLIEIILGQTDKESIKAMLDKLILENNMDINGKVLVLISGRGRPSNFPDNHYFANYTTIADCVGKNRSKFRLVTILKSLRKLK